MAVALPSQFNIPIPSLLVGANVPGQPSGLLLALPSPVPLPIVAAPGGVSFPFIFPGAPSGLVII